MIERLNHAAYRCRDSEETCALYEYFLGLPLVNTLAIGETKTGLAAQVLHTFYQRAAASRSLKNRRPLRLQGATELRSAPGTPGRQGDTRGRDFTCQGQWHGRAWRGRPRFHRINLPARTKWLCGRTVGTDSRPR